ncbi:sprouty-related, EVH1 domain-containing protein 3-like isoform X3 [Homarus americanus]|uniref:sprouty-related, EVH1 domain-containing protein 3-like isoform X3 n=1 Tax=Homarus americanus TaxID=6706 RepID=UPI001C449D00|nr:sprouty-related, EVH1 domain-containing protein 3-like isoform X3 [Homarus americanus]
MSQDLGCGGRMVRWFRLSSSGSGNYLVRVRAQVMMRDDSTGGWLPLGGGGLSNVSVRKRVTQPDLDDPTKHEYLIYGKRISDQHVVLSCTIKKDFEYNKVMPTFHHWKTGDKKFGLTFQTAADARAFDKGVRMAVEDLLDDVGDDNVFMVSDTVNLPVEIDTRSSSGSVNTCSSSRHTPTATPLPTPDHPPHHHVHHPHHVHHFPLPGGGMGGLGSAGGTGISTTNTSPSSTTSNLATSTAGSTTQPYPHPHPHANHHHQQHLCRITFPPRPKPPLPHNNNPPDKPLDLDCELKPGNPPDMPQDQDKIGIPGDNYSYVQFDPDYSYPVVEGIKGEKRDSIASLKKQQQFEHVRGTHPQQMPAPLVPSKRQKKKDKRVRKTIKARCRHCQEMFTYDMNSRGSCEYAPDCVRTAIDSLTCISCAQCMLYHCMSDAEGDFAHHPCECGGPGGTADESCGRRWLGVTLLSLLVPCLWCYLPLRACHRCAVACGLCGGRHEAS